MNVGDTVEIKEAKGSAGWIWPEHPRRGHITEVDKHCFSVRTDDGKNIRDVHEHFRLKVQH